MIAINPYGHTMRGDFNKQKWSLRMYVIVSVYISRISLALELSIKGSFKTPKVYKVSKYSNLSGIFVFKTNSWQMAVNLLLGDSDIIKLLFNTILKYIDEHAIEKLNTQLFYQRKLNYITLHFID